MKSFLTTIFLKLNHCRILLILAKPIYLSFQGCHLSYFAAIVIHFSLQFNSNFFFQPITQQFYYAVEQTALLAPPPPQNQRHKTLLNLWQDICIRKALVLTSIWLQKPSLGKKEFNSESILILLFSALLFLPFLCCCIFCWFHISLAHLACGNVTRNQ